MRQTFAPNEKKSGQMKFFCAFGAGQREPWTWIFQWMYLKIYGRLFNRLIMVQLKGIIIMCVKQRLIRSAWASAESDESSMCAQWIAKNQSFLHVDSEDSDQTGRMPRPTRVFAGRTSVFWFCRVAAHFQNDRYKPNTTKISFLTTRFILISKSMRNLLFLDFLERSFEFNTCSEDGLEGGDLDLRGAGTGLGLAIPSFPAFCISGLLLVFLNWTPKPAPPSVFGKILTTPVSSLESVVVVVSISSTCLLYLKCLGGFGIGFCCVNRTLS